MKKRRKGGKKTKEARKLEEGARWQVRNERRQMEARKKKNRRGEEEIKKKDRCDVRNERKTEGRKKRKKVRRNERGVPK